MARPISLSDSVIFVAVKFKSLILLLLIGASSMHSMAQDRVKVGLYSKYVVHAFDVHADSTQGYMVYGDRNLILGNEDHLNLSIKFVDGQLAVKSGSSDLGLYQTVEVISDRWNAHAITESTIPDMNQREYNGDFIFTATGGKILAVNELVMEAYLAGVVEAETGKRNTIELYKAQSIIARTYALANLNRHMEEGFNICDAVHCQAYHKRSELPIILEASFATEGEVLVDSDIELITASYHSNCGGHTVNSEDVWVKELPYLRGRPDTFCLVMPHAHWEKEIAKSQWLAHLGRKYTFPVEADSAHLLCAVDYEPFEREKYFAHHSYNIPLTKLRKDWRLKSSYFTVREDKDNVVLAGRGYGHGVGLCQEGAIRMAKLGMNYGDILHYYYSDVHLVQLSGIDFFRE